MIMKKKYYTYTALMFAAILVIAGCGPSQKERDESYSIRRADSIAVIESEKARARQSVLDSIQAAQEADRLKKESEFGNQQPLTQYLFITPSSDGPLMRDEKKLKSVLSNIGFSVKLFKEPSNIQLGEPYTFIKASRKEPGGITSIEGITNIHGFESSISEIIINFANQEALNKFIESMIASKYIKRGNEYSNPRNYRFHVEVEIFGKTATITSTLEC